MKLGKQGQHEQQQLHSQEQQHQAAAGASFINRGKQE